MLVILPGHEVDTPQGLIRVSWSKSENRTFEMQIEVLVGISGVICVPTTGPKTGRVFLDGKRAKKGSNDSIVGPITRYDWRRV